MKVLIVDDNEKLTDAVKDFLDSIGIECKVTNEGKEWLNEILTERGRYNLILLDMAMPQFSGYDVLDTLKKEGLLVKIRKHSNFYCILQLPQIPLMIS